MWVWGFSEGQGESAITKVVIFLRGHFITYSLGAPLYRLFLLSIPCPSPSKLATWRFLGHCHRGLYVEQLQPYVTRACCSSRRCMCSYFCSCVPLCRHTQRLCAFLVYLDPGCPILWAIPYKFIAHTLKQEGHPGSRYVWS